MNWLIILLIVFIVIILFYSYFKNWLLGITTVSSQSSLLSPVPPVLAKTFNDPGSTRYSYGIWYYLNTWTTGLDKVIFSRTSDILLYFDDNTASLLCSLPPKTNDPVANVISPSNNNNTPITVTNNFPLQKWVYITVVVDNTIADIYLDGKLVKSVQINQVSPDKSSNLYFGSGYDAYISNFQRWSKPLDPQTVWSTYLAGNGSSSIGTNNYSMNVSLLKDNVTQKTYSIF
jgi:hypothetical protein